MAQEFGALLYELIGRGGMSVSGFAERAGIHQPHLSAIRHGRRPAPMHRLEAWADLLGLRGEERERFLDLGAMTHCPERVRALVDRAEDHQGRTIRELGEGYRVD